MTQEKRIKEIEKTIRQMEKAHTKNPQDWIMATIESLYGQIEAVKLQDPADYI